MSARGPQPFDNDDAQDLVAELREGRSLQPVRAALVLDDDYIEAPEASRALAAAEAVAALNQAPLDGIPDQLQAWVDRGPGRVSQSLLLQARRAVKRIASVSELRELWGEASPAQRFAWEASVADLERRLSQGISKAPTRQTQRKGSDGRPTRVRVREGDLIRIRECGTSWIGIVLHVSRRDRGAIMVGVFPEPFNDEDQVDTNRLREPYVHLPLYTYADAIAVGRWPIVGHSDTLLARSSVPVIRHFNYLLRKDEIASFEDGTPTGAPGLDLDVLLERLADYPDYTVIGPESVENEIARWRCPEEAARRTIEHFRLRGSKLELPRTISHYVHFPDSRSAEAAAQRIGQSGFDTRIWHRGGKTGRPWAVIASHHATLTTEGLLSARASLTTIAEPLNGVHEQWVTDPEP